MTLVENLTALRDLAITTDIVYVKGYNNSGDGGGGFFIWKTDEPFKTGIYSTENYGTIIKSTVVSSNQGSWVRQYENYINVLFFGALGIGNDYTTAFQRAIDFANSNSLYNPSLKGSTVFIPNGSYVLTNIILKNGISILGESMSNTYIYSPNGTSSQYLFEIEAGPITINISNLCLIGNNTPKGCFLFKSQASSVAPFHGGLWNSRFSNINISGFNGNAIYLQGGEKGSNYLLPNQFNIFENISVSKNSDYTYGLYMTGQNAQCTFINCRFDGFKRNNTYSKGQNVRITSTVISFINCTFQDADYGIYIEGGRNITIDNCWFENLGVAITIISKKDTASNEVPSRGVNILNNYFANAAGFGSLNAPNNIKSGQCISIDKSFVSIYNNTVNVSDPNGEYYNNNSSFIYGSNNIIGGINVGNNVFNYAKLGKTYGIMKIVNIVNNTIDCSNNKIIFVNGSNSPITKIISSINAGELINIRANTSSITLKNTYNIFFMTNNANQSLTLENGENATFIKVDNHLSSDIYETYQLISVIKKLS